MTRFQIAAPPRSAQSTRRSPPVTSRANAAAAADRIRSGIRGGVDAAGAAATGLNQLGDQIRAHVQQLMTDAFTAARRPSPVNLGGFPPVAPVSSAAPVTPAAPVTSTAPVTPVDSEVGTMDPPPEGALDPRIEFLIDPTGAGAPLADPVEAVEPETAPAGGFDVPYISQYASDGWEDDWNANSNCGPTTMAMMARGFGYGEGMTDGQLINHLGSVGGTGYAGTSVDGIALMAEEMGKTAEIHGPGADVEWMTEQLEAGKMIAANGDYYAMDPHRNDWATSGHYVCVTGLDADGNFLVQDPADQNVHTVTPAQMEAFINANPNGGWAVAVG